MSSASGGKVGSHWAPYSGCLGTQSMVEITGLAGYDAVFIDTEHMPFDLHQVHTMVLAAERG